LIPITRLFDRRVLVLFESIAYMCAFSNLFELGDARGRICGGSICIEATYGFRNLDPDTWGFDAVVIATDLDLWGDAIAYEILDNLPPGVEAYRGYPLAFTPKLFFVRRIDSELEERLEERYRVAQALRRVRRELGFSKPRLSTLLAIYRLATEEVDTYAVVRPTTCWLAIELGNPPKLLDALERLYLAGRCTYPRTCSECLPPRIARLCGAQPINAGCDQGKIALAPLSRERLGRIERAMLRLIERFGEEVELLDAESAALAHLDIDPDDYVGYRGRLEGARIWGRSPLKARRWSELYELLDPDKPDVEELVDRLEQLAKSYFSRRGVAL